VAEPVPVDAVDPVGAGDAFAAGFLSGWLDGAGVKQCLQRGNLVGAMSVQVPGDVEGFPYRRDLEAMEHRGSDMDR
jgi:sugar/nucleoside kinase (ribokinase family)